MKRLKAICVGSLHSTEKCSMELKTRLFSQLLLAASQLKEPCDFHFGQRVAHYQRILSARGSLKVLKSDHVKFSAESTLLRTSTCMSPQSLGPVCLFYDTMDCSLLGSSVPGISQGRILEWVAIFYSRGSSQPRD